MTLKEYLSEKDRFASAAGVELLEIKEGYARARTLADLAFAAAANSHRTFTLSVSSNISFFRSESDGYLYAEAMELVNHKKVPYIEVRITNEQGDLVALMTSSGYRKACELSVSGLM